MKKVFAAVKDYIKKADMLLLLLCVASTVFGIVMIGSATRVYESGSYVTIQTASLILGIILFVLFSLIDVDVIAEKSFILYIISFLFICTLFIWGIAGDSGNRAWLRFGPIGVQPAEVVKIPFVIIVARTMIVLQERRGINKPASVGVLLAVFAVMFGIIVIASADMGSALVYFFIFAVMLFAGGLSLWWFLAGIAALGACVPLIWNFVLNSGQKARIMAPYDPSIDPSGLGVSWQANQSKAAISAGGLTGQGLYHGEMTQSGSVPQQHTDFIFSAVGEELGFIGCLAVSLLLLAIIARCFYVSYKSGYMLGYLVCTGIGAMMIAQTLENIGMCLGLTPVIGLTLPFFSYGGTSIVTNFVAMGIVAGIKMRARRQRLQGY